MENMSGPSLTILDITDSASPQLAQPSLTEAYHIGVLNPAQCDRLAHGRVSGLAEASPGATRSQGFGSREMSLCRVKPKSAGLVGSVSSNQSILDTIDALSKLDLNGDGHFQKFGNVSIIKIGK